MRCEKCNHLQMESDMRFDLDAAIKWGMNEPVFAGMVCYECGAYIKRPDGPPWKVCFQCGGKMEDSGERIPPKGEAVRALMRCNQCGHTYAMVI